MGAEFAIDPRERQGRFSRRTELTLFLVPMALAFSLAQVSKMFWPTLLAEAPWTLLVMSVNTTRALLVEPLVHPAVFFSLAIARPLVMAPVYYLFGRRYGDVGIRWMKSKLAPESTVMPRLERFFRRFLYPLVAWSPTMVNSTVAGATGMPPIALLRARDHRHGRPRHRSSTSSATCWRRRSRSSRASSASTSGTSRR